MPNLPPVTIPADAFEKAEEKSKGVDYYAELTDDERAEEGLPPREAAKADPAPGIKPDPDDDDEEEEANSDEAIEGLFKEIAGLREDLGAGLGKPEAAPKKKDEDPLLEAALEHEDPVIQGLAERLQKAEARLSEREGEAMSARVQKQQSDDDAAFDALQSGYMVAGKPMTDRHVEAVEDYILKHPEVGSRLSIEQVARVVFPDAVKVGRSPSARGPGAHDNGDGPAVATIVDEGTSGGSTPQPFKPRPNETIESAIAAFGRSAGWRR